MDLVAFSENEGFHLRVPEAGLMSEMNTRFQHLSHRHAGHLSTPMSGYGLRASLTTIRWARHRGLMAPSRCCANRTPGHRFTMRVWIALPKKAALYTMNFQPEQCLKRPRDSMLRTTQISLKTPDEQQKLRVAGALAAAVLDVVGDHVKPGISTDELDAICND